MILFPPISVFFRLRTSEVENSTRRLNIVFFSRCVNIFPPRAMPYDICIIFTDSLLAYCTRRNLVLFTFLFFFQTWYFYPRSCS